MATIIVALDGSEFAERALPVAACRCGPEDRLVLLRVATQDESFNYVDAHLAEQHKEEARLYLEELAVRWRAKGLHVFTEVPVGTPREQILARVREADADLLCMSSHGRTGWKRMVLGNVAESISREAHCPVIICHGEDPLPERLSKALLALDLSPLADRSLDFARQWLAGVELVLFSATPDAHAGLEERAASLRADGWTVTCREAPGPPTPAILEAARTEGVGLVVITRKGRTNLQRMVLGSVAEDLLHQACCPVALIPARP